MTAADGHPWDEHFSTPAGDRRWPNEELVRFLAGREIFNHAIEVGCGTGGNLALLCRHASIVSAVEPNPIAREVASRRLTVASGIGPDRRVVGGTAAAIPAGAGSADLVVDSMVSQHLPWNDHPAVYREYRRVLCDGGWLWLYHLDDQTRSSMVWRGTRSRDARGSEDVSWGVDVEQVGLFPSVELTCLPSRGQLMACVEGAGFTVESRGLSREYPSGEVAHYTIIEARAGDHVKVWV